MFNNLARQGWSRFTLSSIVEADVKEELLSMAYVLGTPVPIRRSQSLCDILIPTMSNNARPRSLSREHSIGEFPLHNDLAHLTIPCRYIILACIAPGDGNRSTIILDTKKVQFTKSQLPLLHKAIFRVINGRQSFYSSILSSARPFVRFDLGCMAAISSDCISAQEIFSRTNWPKYT